MHPNARADGIATAPACTSHCPLCNGAGLTARHCKLICEACGYVESCEDNFPPTWELPREPA